MDEPTRHRRLEGFERLCRDEGLPFTVQRRGVLEAALELDSHPTADQVHEAAARRVPGISRTTVYRTLETLVRMGLLTRACHPGSVARYDRRTDVHHHLVCLRCERVIDICDEHLDAIRVPDTTALGFEVSGYGVQLRGICRSCRQRKEES